MGTKADFIEVCNTGITCHNLWPSPSPDLQGSDFYLQENPEKKMYNNNIVKWMHSKLTFIFKFMNVTNKNCYVMSVKLLNYKIDVTV